jgi:hypothetical protein
LHQRQGLSRSTITVQKINEHELQQEQPQPQPLILEEGKQKESSTTTTTTTTKTTIAAQRTDQQHKFGIGMKVRKYYYGYGWYIGTIQSCENAGDDKSEGAIKKYYRVVYEDGDMEDLDETEVENVIIKESFVTKIPKITLSGKKRGGTNTYTDAKNGTTGKKRKKSEPSTTTTTTTRTAPKENPGRPKRSVNAGKGEEP